MFHHRILILIVATWKRNFLLFFFSLSFLSNPFVKMIFKMIPLQSRETTLIININIGYKKKMGSIRNRITQMRFEYK